LAETVVIGRPMKSRSFDGFQFQMTPGGDRGQRARPDLPLGAQRDAAELLARPEIGIEVGQPVERVNARRRIAESGGEGGILAVQRPLRRPGPHIDLGAAFRVLEAVIAGQGDVQMRRRPPEQSAAHAGIFERVHPIAAGEVEDRAPAPCGGAGDADRERVGDQRAGQGGARLDVAEIADRKLGAAFGLEARRAGDQVDRAGGRVLAVERALRPAQDLDPLDVEEVEGRRGDAAVIDLVDIDADALLDAVIGEAERRAEAADIGRRVARIGRVELEARLDLAEPGHIEAGRRGQPLVADHRDGERHVLQAFVAAPRGDDDVAATGLGGRLGRRRLGRLRPVRRRGRHGAAGFGRGGRRRVLGQGRRRGQRQQSGAGEQGKASDHRSSCCDRAPPAVRSAWVGGTARPGLP
jgi:hypothetical protein